MSPSEAENSSISATIGPVKVCGGSVCGTPFRRHLDHDQGAPEPLDDQRRDEAAAVAAHIDDERFFANLRKVELGEFVQPRLSHVGNVNVADFAAGFLRHFIDVLLHPGPVIERRFIGRRDDSNVSRAIVARLGIDSQNDLFIGRADERVIEIWQSGNRRAVNRQNDNRLPSRSGRFP